MHTVTQSSEKSEWDAIVVGSGPTGGVAALRLVEAGYRVVVVEAGPRFSGEAALQNTEANAGKIMWSPARSYVGGDIVVPKTGMGVGGGSLPWLGVVPRFHPADFRTRSAEGVGEDWPIGYDDLRGHYARIEDELGVAGECGPFAPEAYQLPMPAHRMNWHAQVLARGARKLGMHPFAPPIAINSMARHGRPACIYCGWCASGCPTEAKATSSNTYLGEALRRGARLISEAMVHRVSYDRARGRVTGVDYLDGQRRDHHLTGRLVVLAAHAIETPRLLLLSANASFPEGLANSSGLVGKYFMSHPTWQVFGTFAEPIHAYQGMQMGHVMVQDLYRPDPRRGYARGFILLSYMMTPATLGNLSGLDFGMELKDFLYRYNHTAAWWAHAEGLPCEHNMISLDPELRDPHGLPVARVTYAWCENDRRLVTAARDQAAEMMAASGAEQVRFGLQYAAHAMGGCRMGVDPRSSVVNPLGQTHDIPNLFIVDTSVFVTGAGVNPTLTAMAIANRSTAGIVSLARKGEL